MLRTHTCGELGIRDVGIMVTLCGWVRRVRNKGKRLWVDLRDRYGITQLVVDELTATPELFQISRSVGREYVVQAKGEVKKRIASNPSLATGEVEVQLTELKLLNKSELPPFIIEDDTDGGEELRMRYRYLDLRRGCMQRNFSFRQRLTNIARGYLSERGFIELDTPILIRSTPEGARDFVVPTRKEPGKFYALPQSPQLFKQLFMIAGMDRYFQFARCFRDEDLRSDRQPEFTHLDCELSFVTQKDVMDFFEAFIQHLFFVVRGEKLGDLPVMTYQEAMRFYGTDKPDLRWEFPLCEVTKEFEKTPCPLWECSTVLALRFSGLTMSRRELDQMARFIEEGTWQVGKLTYIVHTVEGIRSPLSKWYGEDSLQAVLQHVQAQMGDLVFLLGGVEKECQMALGALRLHVVQKMKITPSRKVAPLWVVDFPLLEWDVERGGYQAVHHPFTAPKPEHIAWLAESPEKVCAQAYDLVINGTEVAGGSVRIHDRNVQEKVFSTIGMCSEMAEQRFGEFLKALTYGTPPHAGVAFGFDRLCLVMGGGCSIREYIPFPKNNAGRDIMLGAPTFLPESDF